MTEQAGQATAGEARAFWDERYGERPQIWTGNVNAALAGIAAKLEPGSALDLGCGEGGDTVWLAERGWRVTAVDISPTALGRARAAAAGRKIPAENIEWVEADLAAWVPERSYDLVSACFLHSPIEFARALVLRRAAAAVAPGGVLLVVGHAAPPPWADAPSHGTHHFATPQEELESLDLDRDKWEIVVNEVRSRPAVSPQGEKAVLDDTVLIARRTG